MGEKNGAVTNQMAENNIVHPSNIQPGKRRRNEDSTDENSNKRLHRSNNSNGKSRFNCSICNYSTTKRSTLTRHSYRHTGDKPCGPCEICGRRFTRKIGYKAHMRKHGHSFPFECGICGEGFSNEIAWKSHENASKLYQCYLCKKTFRHRKDNLITHMRTHMRKKIP